MRYMLQVYFNGAQDNVAQLPDAERQAIVGEYIAFFATPEVTDGNQLQPPATATTVRVKDSQTVTTHGPFAAPGEPLSSCSSSRPRTSTPRSISQPASRRHAWAAPSRFGLSSSDDPSYWAVSRGTRRGHNCQRNRRDTASGTGRAPPERAGPHQAGPERDARVDREA